ncbi:MAG: anthranilate synthase component I, partial [Abditibacteriota bacterium]|nr:anthranilate synthase component I [Abditibacteriota bacterium]
MNIRPSLEEALETAASGNYRVLPVSCEILSDFITPIEAVRVLKKASRHCFMLESAQASETWGRYTFLGYDPRLLITCSAGKTSVTDQDGQTRLPDGSPSDCLRSILRDYAGCRFGWLPPFTGGLVGYFAYDYIAYAEPGLQIKARDTEEFKDMDLMLFDKVIAF